MDETREAPHVSMAPTRFNGTPLPPPAQPYTPPEPQESPMRVFVNGEVVDRVPVDAATDPGRVQRQQDDEARAKNMVEATTVSYVDAEGRTKNYTPDDRRRQQQIDNYYAAREHWRREQGQDYVPTREEWARGQYTPTPKTVTDAPTQDEPVPTDRRTPYAHRTGWYR